MRNYSKKTIKYYDSIADAYVDSDAMVVLRDKIGTFVKFLSGTRVLDVGCGPGHDSNQMSKMGIDCIGVDLSQNMIGIAQKKSMGEFKVMNVLDLNFKNDTFDGMWCSSIFVHVRKIDLPQLLQNMKRILRSKGVVGIITAKQQKRVKTIRDSREYVMYGKTELESFMKCEGFTVLVSKVFFYGGKSRIFLIAQKNRK